MLDIFVDADACPVKQEIYRVAQRYGLSVTLVSNARMRVPQEQWVKLVVVERNLDAADDWIAEHVSVDDIVVTADIPLAARCLEKHALVFWTCPTIVMQDFGQPSHPIQPSHYYTYHGTYPETIVWFWQSATLKYANIVGTSRLTSPVYCWYVGGW